MKHLWLVVWALRAMWREKSIQRADRVRLFVKTLCLYWSFLGFVDLDQQVDQLHRAMLAALMTAIYDYETDTKPVARFEDSICARLLKTYQVGLEATAVAENMMRQDLARAFSAHGLERGSDALVFYSLVINSSWMADIRPREIRRFGFLLQIIDDLHDYEQDMRSGDQNCLRGSGKEKYLASAQAFIESSFWAELEKRSWVYTFLRFECMRKLDEFSGHARPSFRQFVKVGRLQTAVYAASLTCIGFMLHRPIDWLVMLSSAASFALATMSIMMYNDICDWRIDLRKRKDFAYRNMYALAGFWMKLNVAVVLSLEAVSFYSTGAATLIGLTWFIGLGYAGLKHRELVQSWLVAFCAAMPVLAGSVHHESIKLAVLAVFGFFFFLMNARERLSDIRDRDADQGLKRTLAARHSVNMVSIMSVVMSLMFASICLSPFPVVMMACALLMGAAIICSGPLFIFTRSPWLGSALLSLQLTIVTALVGVFAYTI